jgi:3-hydroxyacyl-[acyl-carrier-protein] dehydratase
MKAQTSLNIPADHPAFAGHFPGTPIVPGVVLLDEALHAIATKAGISPTGWHINSVKFLSPLKPGESAVIEHETQENGSVRFDIISGTRKIVSGSVDISKDQMDSKTL